MDKIQKALVKAGRKDLAQEYYQKIAKAPQMRENKPVQDSIGLLGRLEHIIKNLSVGTSHSKKKKVLNGIKRLVRDVEVLRYL